MPDFLTDVFTLQLAYAFAIVTLGGVMHGYTGWGGGMVMMPLLTLIYSPVEALAIAAIGGLLLTVQLYPPALRTANWRDMRPLYLALLITTPLGGLLLVDLDPVAVRKFIGVIIIAAALLIFSGWQYRGKRGPLAASSFGTVSGLVNGVSGVGGPFFVIYVIAFPDKPDVQRANIVLGAGLMIFLISATLTLSGAIGWDTFVRSVILAPGQMIGGLLGTRIFAMAPQEHFKKITLIAIVVLGASVVIF